MDEEQPKALRLADECDRMAYSITGVLPIAAELRRLHAQIEAMQTMDAETLKRLAADYANEMACEVTSTTNAWPDIEAAQKKLYDAIDVVAGALAAMTAERDTAVSARDAIAKLVDSLNAQLATSRVPAVADGWILPSDKLPPDHESVLVSNQAGVTMGSYSKAFGWVWDELDDEPENVYLSHWMPLPPAPTAK